MNTELYWYLTAGLAALWLATLMTAVDVYVMRVVGKVRIGMLAARWGFVSSVLTFAWILDSKRVAYNEVWLWIYLLVGIVAATTMKVVLSRLVR